MALTSGVSYRWVVHLARMVLVRALGSMATGFSCRNPRKFYHNPESVNMPSAAHVTTGFQQEAISIADYYRFLFSLAWFRPIKMQQLSARLSERGREQESRVRRARPAGVKAASAHQRLGEVRGSHGLSPFQRQLESRLSPSGEDLTAGDILQEHGVSVEGEEGFDGGEHVEDGPLRSAELGMDHRINKQVILTFRTMLKQP